MLKWMLIAVLFLLSVGAGRSYARAPQDDGFNKFYADFQAAVKAADKEKVAGMISFDDFRGKPPTH